MLAAALVVALSCLELALRQRQSLLIPLPTDFLAAVRVLTPWLSLAVLCSSALVASLLTVRRQETPPLFALCSVLFLDATLRLLFGEAWLGAAHEMQVSASLLPGLFWVLILPTLVAWGALLAVERMRPTTPALVLLGGLALGLFAGVLALLPPGSDAATSLRGEQTRSNLLLVTIDTWRYDHLSAHPAAVSSTLTPGLDSLARTSIVFSEARSHAPLTVPAHASMLSGLRPWELGMPSNAASVPPGARWLPELLRAEGYATGAVVSGAVLRGQAGFARGFDSFHEDLHEHAGLEELIAVRLLKQLGRRTVRPVFRAAAPRALERSKTFIARSQRPWFLWMHLFDPHSPYPAIAQGNSPLSGLPNPCSFPQELHNDAPFADLLPTPPPLEAARGCKDQDALESKVRGYQRQVQIADAAVGNLLNWLTARGAIEQTAVIVTADHGESLTEHGLWMSHQFSPYEPVLRVPLLVHPAGGTTGRVSDVLVQHRDLPASASELLGLRSAISGRSWLDRAADVGVAADGQRPSLTVASSAQVRPERRSAGDSPDKSEAAESTRMRIAVRDGRRSVILGPGASLERYNLLDDPAQQIDLSASEESPQDAELLEEARTIQQQWSGGAVSGLSLGDAAQ